MQKKINILIISGHFLPGYKHGGIQKSIINTIDNLSMYFSFKVLTRNHDIGEKLIPYKNIKLNKWNIINNIKVRYLSNKQCSLFNYLDVIRSINFDIIHLNSFFEPLSVYIIFGKWLGVIRPKKIILSSRGDFAWASLKIKYLKKIVYIHLFKILNMQNKIVWHVSSKYEKEDLLKYFKINKVNIITAIDLPSSNLNKSYNKIYKKNLKNKISLRLVFLSRISPEKNLDYAIEILSKLKIKVQFDIYGMIHDKTYWKKCKNLISKKPKNIDINYIGPVEPRNVENIFSKYDIFFFPTGGENYSHVIYESLSVGTLVLTSKDTPWKNLQRKGLGWDIELNRESKFINVLNLYSKLSGEQRNKKRKLVVDNFKINAVSKKNIEANKKLFLL